MDKINENELATKITLIEGKKKNIDEAQVKEILKITLDELANRNIMSVWRLLRKHRK